MWRSLAVGTVGLAVVLGGCAGSGSGANRENGPAADALSLASSLSERLVEEGSVSVEFTLEVAGQTITGEGASRFGEGTDAATAIKIDANGQQTEVRFIDDAVYLQVPEYLGDMMDEGKTWVDLADDESAQTLRGMDGLAKQGSVTELIAQVEQAGTVTTTEEADLDGRPAAKHTIDMRLDKLDEYPMGLGQEYAELLEDAGVESYSVQLWVTDDGLPVKMSMDLAEMYTAIIGGTGQPSGDDEVEEDTTASLMVTFSGWGEAVEVEAPPESEIGTVQMPEPSTESEGDTTSEEGTDSDEGTN